MSRKTKDNEKYFIFIVHAPGFFFTYEMIYIY